MLGIDLDRIEPGHPEQNGGHERMHLDIRNELQSMIEGDLPDHQAAFDIWRREFNCERPHEALGMKVPAKVYRKSTEKYDGVIPEVEYPAGMIERQVSSSGTIRVERLQIYITQALSGWKVGLKPLAAQRWEVWFDHIRLGEIDMRTATLMWPDPALSAS